MDSWDDVDLQVDIRRLARTAKKRPAKIAKVRKKPAVAALIRGPEILKF